jgi:asparagine synthase (glutamine-hydrolysing)
MFFAHGVEFRVPFVYQPVVEFAYTLPASYKIHNGVNKYVLRKLMNKIGLPEYITEREKRKFSDGAGSMFAIEKFVDAAIEDDAYRAAREKHSFLRCKEELYYFQIFTEHFPENWTHLVGFTKRPER